MNAGKNEGLIELNCMVDTDRSPRHCTAPRKSNRSVSETSNLFCIVPFPRIETMNLSMSEKIELSPFLNTEEHTRSKNHDARECFAREGKGFWRAFSLARERRLISRLARERYRSH